LAGVKQGYATDGISYLPTLLGRDSQQNHEYVYFEFHESEGAQAVRKGKWKAVVRGVKKQDPYALELFDLEKDPAEKVNVASQHPDVAAELAAIIKKAHIPSAIFSLPGDGK
jgi:arylsulfatase A-like enzyme